MWNLRNELKFSTVNFQLAFSYNYLLAVTPFLHCTPQNTPNCKHTESKFFETCLSIGKIHRNAYDPIRRLKTHIFLVVSQSIHNPKIRELRRSCIFYLYRMKQY